MAVARPAAPSTPAAQAAARAAQDVAAVVAGLQAQQTAALQQASLRAQQQGALGIASAQYLQGLDLGGRTASDFSNAAAAQVAAAQGFQGGLQQTVGNEAQAVQHNLDVMGGGQVAENQSQAAGNALYALGGYLPSARLGVVGPALAAGQRALPAQTLGFGQMLAQGELGSGQQEAAKYGADISAAYAKQPTLTAQYLDALNEAAAAAAKARQDAAFKEATLRQRAAEAQSRVDIANQKASAPHFFTAGGVGYAWDPSTGAVRQVTKDAPVSSAAGRDHYYQDAAGNDYVRSPDGTIQMLPGQAKTPTPSRPEVRSIGNGGLVRVNPDGSVETLRAPDPATASAPSVAAGTAVPRFDPTRSAGLGYYADQYGHSLYKQPRIYTGWHVGKGGQPVKDVKPGTTKGGIKAPTANQIARQVQDWKTGTSHTVQVPVLDEAGEPVRDANNVPVYRSRTQTTGQLEFIQAYKRLRAQGIGDKQSRQYLQTGWMRGEQGRAWLTNEEQYALQRAGRSTRPAIVNGHAVLMPKQVAALRKVNKLPPGQLTSEGALVIAQTY